MTQSLPKDATPTITNNGDFEWDAHTKTCAAPTEMDELKPIIFSKSRKNQVSVLTKRYYLNNFGEVPCRKCRKARKWVEQHLNESTLIV